MTQLRSNTLGSNGHIPSPPISLSQGSVGLVSVLPTQLTASCLAVTAIQHISPLHYYFMGIYRVSQESHRAAPY
jgi:hypothetical protein